MNTLKDFSNREKLQIHSTKFTKVESSYDLANYLKGGKENKLSEINIEAEFETSGTQAELDAIHKKVENSCPVFQMLTNSGVKINNKWTNIQKK